MSRLFNRKSAAVATVIALIAAGGAYAYFTQTGSGAGSGTTGAGVAVEVIQTSTVSNLTPGSTPQALSGTFNNDNTGGAFVTSITATLDSVTGAAGPLCTIADYQINGGVAAAVGITVAPGDGNGAWSGPTIQMLDLGTNQDDCKGATIHVAYTSV